MLLGSRLNVPLEALGELQLKGLERARGRPRRRAGGPRPARVRLCGELAVEQDGERLDERLPSRQARALFAHLVLERDRAIGRDAIADALWPDVAPRSRDGSLRALLSGVRRVFGPDSIEGRENVRLVLPEGTSVDVEEASASLAAAESSLERGDHQAAATAARRAAALTAQELLAGLNAPWIDERRAEQRELSLQALEIEARAALAAGRPAEAERAARATRRGGAVPRVGPRPADGGTRRGAATSPRRRSRTTGSARSCATSSARPPRPRSWRCTTACWPAAGPPRPGRARARASPPGPARPRGRAPVRGPRRRGRATATGAGRARGGARPA